MIVREPRLPRIPPQLHHKNTTFCSRFCQNPQQKRANPSGKNYCNKVPSSGCVLASSGGITTAAATVSSASRSSSLTPALEGEERDGCYGECVAHGWLPPDLLLRRGGSALHR